MLHFRFPPRPARAVLLAIPLLLVAAEDDGTFRNVPAPAEAPVVREGRSFVTTITIRNRKDRAMKIVDHNASCDCTELELGTEFLLPGQSTTLRLRSPTANQSGPHTERIWFYPSDPTLGSIRVEAYWRVQAMVTVDCLPPGQRRPERPGVLDPENRVYHDVYTFLTQAKPDEPKRLRENVLLTSPEPETPEGGFAVTAVDYEGDIWRFIVQPLPDDPEKVMLLARAREGVGPDQPLAEQVVNERVVVHTNHPDKAEIVLHFWTAIDHRVGSPEFRDPFAEFK